MEMVLPALSGVHLINLVGQTTVNELVEVVRRAQLFIGADSATFHVAAALRKPAICLAGGGHWGRFVPWGMTERTKVLTHKLDCFGCNWACGRATVDCIAGIETDDVIRHARELLVL